MEDPADNEHHCHHPLYMIKVSICFFKFVSEVDCVEVGSWAILGMLDLRQHRIKVTFDDRACRYQRLGIYRW